MLNLDFDVKHTKIYQEVVSAGMKIELRKSTK